MTNPACYDRIILAFENMYIKRIAIWSSTQVGDGHFKEALPVADEATLKWRSGRNLSALQAVINFGNRKRARSRETYKYFECRNL